MNTQQPPISDHRRMRLTAWAKLWLQGFAAFLPLLLSWNPELARRGAARCARIASDLVVLHAAARARSVHGKRRRPSRQRPFSYMRAVKGSRLRKRLRARDTVGRFFAALSVIRDLDAEAERLARRLSRGLTRRAPIKPAPGTDSARELSAAPICARSPDASLIDTS